MLSSGIAKENEIRKILIQTKKKTVPSDWTWGLADWSDRTWSLAPLNLFHFSLFFEYLMKL